MNLELEQARQQIDRFIQANKETTHSDVLRAYRNWVSTPMSEVLEGHGFVAYPPKYAKMLEKVRK